MFGNGNCITIMIRNLEMEPALAVDVIDPEATIKLMTDALDLYYERVAATARVKILAPAMVDHDLEIVISTALVETNPHLRDKFYMTFRHETPDDYRVSITIHKNALQQHLEFVTAGTNLCH